MATAWVSQGDTEVVNQGTANIRASQYSLDVVYNIPSEFMRASQLDADVVNAGTEETEVSQFDMDVVMRGKVYNPKLRCWTFDLDGHEFYVLRLGDSKTLVYDLTTEQWAWWSSETGGHWRPSVGTNWTNAGNLPYGYGSNVVVGDDTFGALSILNPLKGMDDSVRDIGTTITFPRVATGQMTMRGRETNRCHQVYVVGDLGRPAYVGASVELSYSDDGGRTFVSAGSIPVETGNYYQEIVWRSLGHIRAPGRLFRVSDDGALPQIDEMTVYDDTAA